MDLNNRMKLADKIVQEETQLQNDLDDALTSKVKDTIDELNRSQKEKTWATISIIAAAEEKMRAYFDHDPMNAVESYKKSTKLWAETLLKSIDDMGHREEGIAIFETEIDSSPLLKEVGEAPNEITKWSHETLEQHNKVARRQRQAAASAVDAAGMIFKQIL